jgi:hypothetical protein
MTHCTNQEVGEVVMAVRDPNCQEGRHIWHAQTDKGALTKGISKISGYIETIWLMDAY